jgi:hypothetical protein
LAPKPAKFGFFLIFDQLFLIFSPRAQKTVNELAKNRKRSLHFKKEYVTIFLEFEKNGTKRKGLLFV